MKIEIDVNLEQMIELKLAMEDKVNALSNRMEVCSSIMSTTQYLKLKARYEICEKLLETITNIYEEY